MKTTTKFELVDISKLVPYVNNARTHSDEQIKKLRSSLREFGFISPVIIDKDFGIIAGHGRVQAAKLEGIKQIPCVFAEHLTETQKKAYILADNRMALDAGWDDELLKLDLESLKFDDFDLSLTGFDDIEIDNLLEQDGDNVRDDKKILKDTFQLIIDCEDEEDLQQKYEQLTEEGYICRVSTL